ncbi:MAG: choice-of-anchor B domain-containing protein [Rhodothermales bacterium]|jgi:choice-of-anchor B domain-containing protein
MKRVALLSAFLLAPMLVLAQSTPAGSSMGAGFGGAIAGMGPEFVIGSAPIGWQSGDEPPGTVYRYRKNAEGEWSIYATMQSPNPEVGDDFGRSVLSHGPHIAIGAPGQATAYIFERNEAGDFPMLTMVTPADLPEGFEFAGAYARAGFRTQTLAFAAGHFAATSFNSETSTGAVHFFGQDGTETVIRGAEGEGFGYAIVGNTQDPIFIGVPGADGDKGAVDVYVHRDGMLVPEGRLTAEDLTPRSGLGRALAWQDGVLYAGVPGLNAVLRFQKTDAGEWAELERLTGPEGESAGLGSGVAVQGDMVLAGDRRSAWLFQGGTFAQISAPSPRAERGFGTGLAMADGAVAVASPSADYGEGIVSVFEPSDEGWMSTGTLAPDVFFLESIRGNETDCEEGSAGLFGCDNVDLISLVSAEELASERGVKMTDIWGWEDPETGHEWVLMGRTDGTVFVNIADPANPVYVGELLRTEGSPGAAWRDVKVYKNHAFIVADGSGEHGTQIFDLTQLRDVDPADMPVTFEETAHYSGTASTHNMVINEDTGFAYAVGNRAGGETCNGQSHMIDIRDPVNPKFAGCFSEPQSGGTHDAQCVLYHGPDADYSGSEICLSSNGNSFVISDVTDKENPSTVAYATYPLTHYTHQGWLDESHSYFYMNDELDEMNGAVENTRTLIWDVQDLDDPQLVNQFYLDSAASDHNLYTRGNYMYQSNYQAGLRILDITDPVNPVEVGNFDTSPYAEDAPGFGGSWSNYPYFKSGVIAVSSGSEGLFLVRFRKVDS